VVKVAVVDGGLYFFGKLRRDLIHAVIGLCVFSALLQDLLLGLAAGFEVAVDTDVPASDDFSHVASFGDDGILLLAGCGGATGDGCHWSAPQK